ncbi:ArsR/SmtB family transcription factor [Cellulomonas soli]|uniref:Transcriptional regulator n=1 Tax=Cellulomonas soli TaxID=931535 RepID=A0A512P9T0_9CELL|nr:winged helix-turn-helix domain-containing protein [Cellulomonas soli]NYI60448.1 DNA-binding transcriptional ArsR family regulator [Cellulomonas soli]GEP67963.1 transcriptional regulator [Cellulomonas soli]
MTTREHDSDADDPLDLTGDDLPLDVRRLKALAHPLRTQIFDALTTGPATASGLAQRLGESSGATSYHLRQLAEHGFVEEMPGRGTARERWWQLAPGRHALSSSADESAAAREALDMFASEWMRLRYQAAAEFRTRVRAGLEPAWKGKASDATTLFVMTPDELEAMTGELVAVLDRWDDRCGRERADVPDGARVVELQLRAFPRVGSAVDFHDTARAVAPTETEAS